MECRVLDICVYDTLPTLPKLLLPPIHTCVHLKILTVRLLWEMQVPRFLQDEPHEVKVVVSVELKPRPKVV